MEMKFLGSKITKINAEKKPDFDGTLELNTNINIKSIEKFQPENTNIESLKVNAVFEVKYGELGEISIEGQLYLSTEQKIMEDIIESFKSNKYDTPEQLAIMNIIIQRFSIKAFELEEELGLPIHIRLPTLQAKKEE